MEQGIFDALLAQGPIVAILAIGLYALWRTWRAEAKQNAITRETDHQHLEKVLTEVILETRQVIANNTEALRSVCAQVDAALALRSQQNDIEAKLDIITAAIQPES